MAGSTTESTAVTGLVAGPQARGPGGDDRLFTSPRKPTLPPPNRARGQRSDASIAVPPAVMPAASMPSMAAEAAPAARAPNEHEAPTRPFDHVEAEAVRDEDDDGRGRGG